MTDTARSITENCGGLSDADMAFLAAFEAGDLEAAQFDHKAHVQLGWIHVRAYPLNEAIERFRTGLKRFTETVGAAGKYHETVTWFYLLLIAERDAGSDFGDFEAFLGANRDLVATGAPLLTAYYGPGILEKPLARRQFILPRG